MARGVTAWVHLFGFLNFEIFGRLADVFDDVDSYFHYEMKAAARTAGIT